MDINARIEELEKEVALLRRLVELQEQKEKLRDKLNVLSPMPVVPGFPDPLPFKSIPACDPLPKSVERRMRWRKT